MDGPLDCEMCYTTYGIELTRVTVVDEDGADAYESFVKPDSPILDYNTRYDTRFCALNLIYMVKLSKILCEEFFSKFVKPDNPILDYNTRYEFFSMTSLLKR
jgi:DNA polymerase III epsilon subunit-like protein